MEWAWFGVGKNTGVKSENIPFSDFTRVDCGRPRIYPRVDPELYPRGRLRWLPESTPPSQDLPLYCDNEKCIWLPESARQSRNIPPFSTTIFDPPCIFPSQNLHPLSLRIYLSSPFNNYMRIS